MNFVRLVNFRNHKKFNTDLVNTTVLIGPNGSGKTSVLEAISLVSVGRSFRVDDKKAMVKTNCDFARASVDNLEMFIQKDPRLLVSAKENGVKKKFSEFIGNIKTVVFSPETINIISGGKTERRRFLDMMISQVDLGYLRALIEYTKVRRQRNSLLEAIKGNRANEKELLFWDVELTKQGRIITKNREIAVKYLNQYLGDIYQKISGQKEASFALSYLDKSGDDLEKKLAQNRAREIAYGATIYGPHRDDLEFALNSANMQQFASRGELRSAILALKIGELKFLEREAKNRISNGKNSVTPTLLLDDVFSEFDSERREHLNQLILDYQSIITATDRDHLSSKLLKSAKVVEL